MTTIRDVLTANAPVTAQVGTRIYPVRLPQNPTYPCVSYQVISGVDVMTHDGPLDLDNATFQVDCWGSTYASMDATFKLVKSALNGYKAGTIQGIFLERKRDLPYDSDANVYRRTADFSVWNKEPV